MTPAEEGYILLCSHLGRPQRPVLTPTMLKHVQQQVKAVRQRYPERVLSTQELLKIGLKPELAERVWSLLNDRAEMREYVAKGAEWSCYPMTPASPCFPWLMYDRLGLDGPGCLWAKGDPKILNHASISVVGSRDINMREGRFAEKAGEEAAKQGFVLVSGNARGTDQAAQNACADHDGLVISVVADRLDRKFHYTQFLYLSENDFDMDFTAARALSRNRVIHAMSQITLVSRCEEGKGGTWSGTTQNLKNHWSPVAAFQNNDTGNAALHRMGAALIGMEELEDYPKLCAELGAPLL